MDATPLEIRALNATPDTLEQLGELIVEVVAHGGSVSFMHPLEPSAARAFWARSLESAARGERVVLGAWRDETLEGTVTLLLDFPPNQPHRAEIAKMMTRVRARGRGVARALLLEAERIAVERGRWLLMLDTASDEGASGLYEKLGFVFAGEVPDFALKPHGGLTGTKFYWKRLVEHPV
jgi:ribosomal protein S18 acetylase RimI-like enzyme